VLADIRRHSIVRKALVLYALATAMCVGIVWVAIPTPEASAATYSTAWQDAYNYMHRRCDTGFFDTTSCVSVTVTGMAPIGWSSPAPGALPPLNWNGAWRWKGRTVEQESGVCRLTSTYRGRVAKSGATTATRTTRRNC
jgi:hypothetical protein